MSLARPDRNNEKKDFYKEKCKEIYQSDLCEKCGNRLKDGAASVLSIFMTATKQIVQFFCTGYWLHFLLSTTIHHNSCGFCRFLTREFIENNTDEFMWRWATCPFEGRLPSIYIQCGKQTAFISVSLVSALTSEN
jgi:hypothetical protein